MELSGGTGRQCRGVVRAHWGQCSGAVRHGGSSRGPDHQASPTLMADLQQLQQQDPVLRPVLAAWPAKPSSIKERSTRALVQQYPRRFLKNGIPRRGQADQRRVTLEQLVLFRSLRPDVPREARDYISICERCSSTLNGSWRMGSPVVGRLTNVALPLNSWFFPAHFGLLSQERSGTTSASARDALWYHALGKRKGIWCLVWSFGNALCLYVNGLP